MQIDLAGSKEEAKVKLPDVSLIKPHEGHFKDFLTLSVVD